jgi:hypothetical protein
MRTIPLVFILAAGCVPGYTPTQPPPKNNNPNTPPPAQPANGPFDLNVFQTQIQPALDAAGGKGCTNANCHGAAAGAGGLHMIASPAKDSADMKSNFMNVTALCDLNVPQNSTFYKKATTLHAGGASVQVSASDATNILNWIAQAKAVNTGTQNPTGNNAGCPDPSNFNVGVFQSYLEPILFGQRDLNNPGSQAITTGCSRATCHGTDRGPGTLVIKDTNTAAQNLASFACFVNLKDPILSDILSCPTDEASCPKYPHPGQNVFANSADLNYQAVLGFLYSAKQATTPLDFAFFARQIQPIFDDPTLAGSPNRTCADGQCHGVAVAGQAPSNSSNFPILSNAGDKSRLLVNFSAAANFANFLSPTGSPLFLYPTNEIADTANNKFATGLPHPGGIDFAVNSTQANAILQWAGGLRPNGNGVNQNWLVAGTFSVATINDPTAIDEANSTPQIFDPMGASQFNGGVWDGLFSAAEVVDMNVEFPQAVNGGRAGYALTYVINTTSTDISAQVTVSSPNVIKMWAGKTVVQNTDNAVAGAPTVVTLPAYSTSKTATRLLLKVFQRQADNAFNFKMSFTDVNSGQLLTNTTGELVFKLSPDGGI